MNNLRSTWVVGIANSAGWRVSVVRTFRDPLNLGRQVRGQE